MWKIFIFARRIFIFASLLLSVLQPTWAMGPCGESGMVHDFYENQGKLVRWVGGLEDGSAIEILLADGEKEWTILRTFRQDKVWVSCFLSTGPVWRFVHLKDKAKKVE